MKVALIVTGRSYHHTAALPEVLHLSDGSTLDDALTALQAAVPNDNPQRPNVTGNLASSGTTTLPPSCLIAVSGRHLGTLARHANCPLRDGDEIVLLAPVAGG
jgi:molybdopterin converting factor small subunit